MDPRRHRQPGHSHLREAGITQGRQGNQHLLRRAADNAAPLCQRLAGCWQQAPRGRRQAVRAAHLQLPHAGLLLAHLQTVYAY